MATTTPGYETKSQQQLEMRWLPFINRTILFRSAIIAFAIGNVLTLITQFEWVMGRESIQLLPFMLAFATPFFVIAISQIAGERQAYGDAATRNTATVSESFFATAISHGIPARALAIGLTIGSADAVIILAATFIRSGGLAEVSVSLLGQVFLLPLLFGVLSQAIAYKRAVSWSQRRSELKPTMLYSINSQK
jgi:hypothetical protein